jgi:hypothetical protein
LRLPLFTFWIRINPWWIPFHENNPDTPANSPVPATLTRERNPKESPLEIYDPDRGTVFRIYRDQDASGPLKIYITAVLYAIQFQNALPENGVRITGTPSICPRSLFLQP